MKDIVLRPVLDLRATEETDPPHADAVASLILRAGVWTTPVCIERETGAVMDGHHRLAAAHRLGLQMIPVVPLTYDQVELQAWRSGFEVSPIEIVRRALAGDLYPPKTTRHLFPEALPTCLVPLARLRLEQDFGRHVEWVWNGEGTPNVQVPGARYGVAQRRFRTAA
jgi:hypothetical protein